MRFVRTLVAILLSVFVLAPVALAQPPMPAGFDIRSNSVRGAETGEPLTLQITPYNAGKMLFSNDRVTIYERINFLSDDPDQFGDPICTVTDPNTENERYHSRVIAVFNVDRTTPISEDMVWTELQAALTKTIHPTICPKANYITAHIYARNWDLTSAGQIYHPEFVPMPVVELGPKKPPKDVGDYVIDVWNKSAYDLIQEVVSEGIMVAHFQYPIGEHHGCNSEYSMDGCTKQTFAPLYWGAPDQMMVYQLNNEFLRYPSYRNSYAKRLEKVRAEYAQYTSFDGYVRGFKARTARNKQARAHNAARQEALNRFNQMVREGLERIEEDGIGVIVTPGGPVGPCDHRFYAGSCIEDVIHIPGYL